MFTPITNSMEERLELIKNSMSKEIALEELKKCESLEDFHWFAQKVKNGIVSQMELYVLENYEKIPLEIWNKGNFKLYPHTGTEYIHFGKEDIYTPRKNEFINKIFKKSHDRSIKIDSISFTLDEIDGDFSVNFNDGTWAFIWQDEILDYYHTVKNYLTDEK